MTSKVEYLKRYVSSESDVKKKKKQKKPAVIITSRVKILDDDVDFKSLLPVNISNTLDDDIGDDNPAVAEFVDERPQHVKELEMFRQSKQWKLVTQPHDSGDKSHKASTVSSSVKSAERSVKSSGGSTADQRRERHDSDSDLDVPRNTSRQRHNSDSDISPVRTQRHDSKSSSDLSPVRPDSHPDRHHASSDLVSKISNLSSRRHDSDSDLSPVRTSGSTDHIVSSTSAGKRSRRRHDSDSDLSPKRSRNHSKTAHSGSDHPDSDSDLSPVRTKGQSQQQRDSDFDLLPVRAGSHSAQRPQSSSKHHHRKLSPENTRLTKTLSGAKAGLQSAGDLRKEFEQLRKRDHDAFAQIPEEMSGKNAQPIMRDQATGRKRDLDAERAKQAEIDAAKAVTTAKYDAWNKGLRQKELKEEKISDALHEAEKPLARYSDDADLDARLREQEREGDTMLAYIRKKKDKGTAKSKPVYRGPDPPPNRFGIRPGYRWDGVDRSNGFEKLYFTKLSEKKAIKDMAYKWSVENM